MKSLLASKHPVLRISAATLLLCLIAAAIIVPTLKHRQNTNTTSGLHIVAAENFWGNIAEQIGGNKVQVTSIISDPEADPHLYESSAKDAGELSKADVVVTNGVGYDDFMDKMLKASPKSDRTTINAADIMNAKGDDANPHLWYDIPRVHLMADAIARSFAAKDPGNKAIYEANARAFDASLAPLLNTIATIKQQHPAAPVMYTERVAGYLLADAGLDNKTPAGFASAIEDDTDPSPADTQAMNDLLTQRQVKALLYNSQASSPLTETLQSRAKQQGVAVVGVSETLPPEYKSYQSWQQAQLDALQKALNSQ